jgi:hypothetical protein
MDPFVFLAFFVLLLIILVILQVLVWELNMTQQVPSIERENFRTCIALFSIYDILVITSYMLQ